jgi:hypothetical protein
MKPRMVELQKLLPNAQIFPTGSRYVCNPPIMGTDIDFIVYNEHDLEAFLTKEGYSRSTLKEYLYCEKFNFLTVRKGRVNLIVST